MFVKRHITQASYFICWRLLGHGDEVNELRGFLPRPRVAGQGGVHVVFEFCEVLSFLGIVQIQNLNFHLAVPQRLGHPEAVKGVFRAVKSQRTEQGAQLYGTEVMVAQGESEFGTRPERGKAGGNPFVVVGRWVIFHAIGVNGVAFPASDFGPLLHKGLVVGYCTSHFLAHVRRKIRRLGAR